MQQDGNHLKRNIMHTIRQDKYTVVEYDYSNTNQTPYYWKFHTKRAMLAFISRVDLSRSRLEIINNLSAQTPERYK